MPTVQLDEQITDILARAADHAETHTGDTRTLAADAIGAALGYTRPIDVDFYVIPCVIDPDGAPHPAFAATDRVKQNRHMHALWKSGGIEDRDERLAITGVLVGRPVASSSELTAAEADTVIARLRDADRGTGALYQACSRWLDEAAAATDEVPAGAS